jgi:hypothetical protein
VIGAAFLTPESGRLRELVTAKGMDDPETKERMDRITLATRLDTIILVVIVADMVIKPGA